MVHDDVVAGANGQGINFIVHVFARPDAQMAQNDVVRAGDLQFVIQILQGLKKVIKIKS